jgi:Na+-translocating ferredoxin:NAD+ oxidoreductase RnfC subunit
VSDLLSIHQAWLKDQQERPENKKNPMIKVYGLGPEGAVCGSCKHLVCPNGYYTNRYYKCELRKISKSAASDHRKGWPACAKFNPQEGA